MLIWILVRVGFSSGDSHLLHSMHIGLSGIECVQVKLKVWCAEGNYTGKWDTWSDFWLKHQRSKTMLDFLKKNSNGDKKKHLEKVQRLYKSQNHLRAGFLQRFHLFLKCVLLGLICCRLRAALFWLGDLKATSYRQPYCMNGLAEIICFKPHFITIKKVYQKLLWIETRT